MRVILSDDDNENKIKWGIYIYIGSPPTPIFGKGKNLVGRREAVVCHGHCTYDRHCKKCITGDKYFIRAACCRVREIKIKNIHNHKFLLFRPFLEISRRYISTEPLKVSNEVVGENIYCI